MSSIEHKTREMVKLYFTTHTQCAYAGKDVYNYDVECIYIYKYIYI
jgi:hypothetical protein